MVIKQLRDKIKDLSFSDKIQLILATGISTTLLVGLPAYAWFSNKRELFTATKLNPPLSIELGADGSKDIEYLMISGIDLTDSKGYADYVFRVDRDKVPKYKLQLAYTTNVPLTYSVYDVETEVTTDDDKETDEYVIKDKIKYKRGNQLHIEDGVNKGFLNLSGDGRTADKNNDIHKHSYSDYNRVQEYAEPVYWQSQLIDCSDNKTDNDYYILRISWPSGLENRKETDMICITAGIPET